MSQRIGDNNSPNTDYSRFDANLSSVPNPARTDGVKQTSSVGGVGDIDEVGQVEGTPNTYLGGELHLPPAMPRSVEWNQEMAEGAESFARSLEAVDLGSAFNFVEFQSALQNYNKIYGAQAEANLRQVLAGDTQPKSDDSVELTLIKINAASVPGASMAAATSGVAKAVAMSSSGGLDADNLLAAFLKANMTDPNISVETQNDLGSMMSSLRISANKDEQAKAEAAKKKIEAAKHKTNKMNELSLAITIVAIVAAVLLAALSGGMAAPAAAVVIVGATAAAAASAAAAAVVAGAIIGLAAGIGAAEAQRKGEDPNKGALQAASYGAMAASVVCGVGAIASVVANAVAAAAKSAAQAAAVIAENAARAATEGAQIAAKAAEEAARHAASEAVKQTASQAAQRAAAQAAYAEQVAIGMRTAADQAAKAAVKEALTKYAGYLVVPQTINTATTSGMQVGKAKLEYEASMLQADANELTADAREAAIFAELFQDLLEAQNDVISTVLDLKNQSIDAVLKAQNNLMASKMATIALMK